MKNTDYDDMAQWKPFTWHSTVICSCWECDIRPSYHSGRHSVCTENRMMGGWKQFVPNNILVCNRCKLSCESSISREDTLDEIRKPYGLLWCSAMGGIITSCWQQVPRLLSCILHLIWSISIKEKMKHIFLHSEVWAQSFLTTEYSRHKPIVERHARKCESSTDHCKSRWDKMGKKCIWKSDENIIILIYFRLFVQ